MSTIVPSRNTSRSGSRRSNAGFSVSSIMRSSRVGSLSAAMIISTITTTSITR